MYSLMSLGELIVSELESYILSENKYSERLRKLDEGEIASSYTKNPECFSNKVALSAKRVDLNMQLALSFYPRNEEAMYDVSSLVIFFRPKPKWFQFFLKAKQKLIEIDAIDFRYTLKKKSKFVLSLSQNYKENDNLFVKPVFTGDKDSISIKENYMDKNLELSISCDGYFMNSKENPQTFSRDELSTLINALATNYVNEFNKLKKIDFEF